MRTHMHAQMCLCACARALVQGCVAHRVRNVHLAICARREKAARAHASCSRGYQFLVR